MCSPTSAKTCVTPWAFSHSAAIRPPRIGVLLIECRSTGELETGPARASTEPVDPRRRPDPDERAADDAVDPDGADAATAPDPRPCPEGKPRIARVAAVVPHD